MAKCSKCNHEVRRGASVKHTEIASSGSESLHFSDNGFWLFLTEDCQVNDCKCDEPEELK